MDTSFRLPRFRGQVPKFPVVKRVVKIEVKRVVKHGHQLAPAPFARTTGAQIRSSKESSKDCSKESSRASSKESSKACTPARKQAHYYSVKRDLQ